MNTFNVDRALAAYRRGDRIGAPWETGDVGWSPLSLDQIMRRANVHPKGTDESDIIDCFEAFTGQYEYAGDRANFLVSWADYHEKHRRHTTYGGTWKSYFNAVKYLRKKDRLSLESIYLCARECKPGGGSAGNGFFALVLPVYSYALKIHEDPHEMVGAVVRLSHAHPVALSCAHFMINLFDAMRGIVDELTTTECCPAIDRYYGCDEKRGPDATYGWDCTPDEFARSFPDNILCCNTLVHALYAMHTAKDEQDLISKVVGLRGDVDSVLGLSLMMYRLSRD